MADGKQVLGKVTGWLGVITGAFTIIVWCFLLSARDPKIKLDSEDALNDINKVFWRLALFTFTPSVFFDIWTPFVMGFVSILCHFQKFDLTWMCKTYIHYFIWNFALGLFGNIGYAGGVGIICSAFAFLTALLSLICIFILPGESPKLGLNSPKVSTR
ncbi:hypothetical protein, conserved [Eimeria necatrix]|uniref:Transmembrane protein n=1 Tax=Eimeria necatrix TaxID=51315 RepID=U6MJ09_9EIME|nr:hypothetical protein, conserved [Eimeria necatrix]CDJ63033.1 hypothetical protein, conserved [Eimeria necatrix]